MAGAKSADEKEPIASAERADAKEPTNVAAEGGENRCDNECGTTKTLAHGLDTKLNEGGVGFHDL